MVKLISFDIDGTLEVGDPPGPITLEIVSQAKDLGCLIGSCSDRSLSDQRRLWEQHHISVDFMVLKHRLAEVKTRFQADVYYHVGDTDRDHFFANQAGFRFVKADALKRLETGERLQQVKLVEYDKAHYEDICTLLDRFAAAYCQARAKLPLRFFDLLLERFASAVQPCLSSEGLWHGHRASLVDGSECSTPDTPLPYGTPSASRQGSDRGAAFPWRDGWGCSMPALDSS